MNHPLHQLFNPASVVVIGVSPRRRNLGRNILNNLQTFGFPGPVYAVSPKGGEYHGRTIYQDVSELPETPELAVVLTPAATVPAIMEACGKKGITRMVIESGGFSELDRDRGQLEAELKAIAEKYGIRFVGPNCIGVINNVLGLAVPFPLIPRIPAKGGVSIVAQSGGIGLTYLNGCTQEGLGVAKFASVGNKLNLNERDFVSYLAKDPETELILLHLESIVAGRELFEIIKDCNKPVVVHKANIAETSHAIAHSHTAALANDDQVVDVALRQAGALRAETVTDALNFCKALVMPAPKGDRLAVISRSGGHAVVSADAAHRHHMELPPYPASYLKAIETQTRASVIHLQNPLDLGDLFDFDLYVEILRGAIRQESVDSVLVVHGYRGPEAKTSRGFVAKAGEISKEAGKPVAMVLLTDPEEMQEAQKLSTLPFFPAPDEAVRALAGSAWLAKQPHGLRAEALPKLDFQAIQEALKLARPDGVLELPESLALARAAGIPVAPFAVAKSPQEAAQAAESLGFSVVLKAVGIGHKTEENGVILNLASAGQVQEAASEMQNRLEVKRLLLMAQVDMPHELIMGIKRDPSFGPVILAGAGGIAAEIYKDTALRLAPVGEQQAGEMLDELLSARLLKGYRGRPETFRPGLCQAIARLAALAMEAPQIAEMDLNPVMAGPKEVMAVDARVRLAIEA